MNIKATQIEATLSNAQRGAGWSQTNQMIIMGA